MAFRFELAGAQIDGARDYQEDAFLITHLSDAEGNAGALVIVADGMGGHAAGNVASNMAVQAFNKNISTNYPTNSHSEVLNQSIIKANGSLTDTIKETQALGGMGCTMIGAILEKNHLWWASVGDSHLYIMRDRKLVKLNEDHSYGGYLDRMEAAGTPVPKEKGLSRNMLMSALTGDDIPEVDCPTEPFTLQHNDKIIICSDGMDTLSEGKMIQYLDWSDTPKECADALMDAVEGANAPRQDNTTAVVVKIIDEGIQAAESKDMEALMTFEEEDEGEADITQPDGATTRTETKPARAETVQTRPERQPPPPRPIVKDTQPAKSKKGLIFMLIILALGGGGYFAIENKIIKLPKQVADLITPKKVTKPSKDTEIQQAKQVASAPKEEAPQAEPKKTIAKETKPETIKEKPVITEPAKPTVPKAVGKQEFQDPLKNGGVGPTMILIPAGTYSMGSNSSNNERPKHTVNIKSFAIGKYEVTFADYDLFAKATGRQIPESGRMKRSTHPVINISWDDAYSYTKWLSEQTGKKYRLPSETEWEYAASTGKKSPFWWGYDEQAGEAHCFGCDSGFDPRQPGKIGSFKPNNFKLHDTAGNVAEWVHDCWHENYQGAPNDNSVWEGGDCSFRVIRGGSYLSPPQSLRSAKRDKFKSDNNYDHVGFRLARD